MVAITGARKEMSEPNKRVTAIRWDGTQHNTRRVLEFMGQTVCTRTPTACDYFFDYVKSVAKKGLPVTTEFGEVKITKGSWVIKEIDGTFSVSSDLNFKHRRSGVLVNG